MLWSESSTSFSLPGTKVPGNESSTYGTFAPGSESTRERKFHNSISGQSDQMSKISGQNRGRPPNPIPNPISNPKFYLNPDPNPITNPIPNPKAYPNPIPNPKPNPKCYRNRVRWSPTVLPNFGTTADFRTISGHL